MDIGNVIVGYYFYVLIFGFLAAFIFRPLMMSHKNLRKITLILNLGNIVLYVIVAIISIKEKISVKDIFSIIWSGKINFKI